MQILTQLQSMYFFNNDQMPTKVIFQLDVKSLLKNAQLSKDDQDDWNEYKKYCSDIKKRTKVFLHFIIVDRLSNVLDDLSIEYWNLHYINFKSVWQYSVEIVINPRYSTNLFN